MKGFRKSGIKAMILMAVLAVAVSIAPAALAKARNWTDEDNAAPVAENLEYVTYKDVAINGTLQAIDPEGDMVEYKLITEPKKGTVDVSEDGEFTYTPKEDKKGKDTFAYVAVDAMGNVSEEATVKINIEKQSSHVNYGDMEGNSAHYAALRLAEEGILVGEMIGDIHYFSPDTVVTRGEFLAMCMNVTGAEILQDISRTGFSDDEDIASWLKPYVTTAVMSGAVKGISDGDGELVFAADDPITLAQAVVMLDRVMEISDVSVSESDSVPAWAAQAASNLSVCNVIDVGAGNDYSSEMTRADVAELIISSIDTMDDDTAGALLSWAQ